MPLAVTKVVDWVLSQCARNSELLSEGWVRHFGLKCAKVAPGAPAPGGFDAAIRHECYRVMVYGAIALAGDALKGHGSADEIGRVRAILQAALSGAPPELGGNPATTKARVGAYHAAWKEGGSAALAPVLAAALVEASGVKGTPFESAADSVTKLSAAEWPTWSLKAYAFVLERK